MKPVSRDGARLAFQDLEAIARVAHVPGREGYGLRRVAADMAETETTDDRVKDRLGGWKDSETRKHIYQDRERDRLRAEAPAAFAAANHLPAWPGVVATMPARI